MFLIRIGDSAVCRVGARSEGNNSCTLTPADSVGLAEAAKPHLFNAVVK